MSIATATTTHHQQQQQCVAHYGLPSALVPPLDNNRRLIAALSEAVDRPASWVRAMLIRDEQLLGAESADVFRRAGLKPHVYSDEHNRVYYESPEYLVSLAVWNRRTEKLLMRDWIGRYLTSLGRKALEVLTVGDGPGFDGLYLSLCGHRVTYFDESAVGLRFARSSFAAANQSVRLIDDRRQIPPESFDVLVCLDVLEHVPDPSSFVQFLVTRLRPGGRFIVHAPFFFLTWHNPTHLRSNLRYSGSLRRMYGTHGLQLEDGRPFWDPLVWYKPRDADDRAPGSARRRFLLRAAGLLLGTARIWSGPHNRIALRAMQRGDGRWLRQLQVDSETGDGSSSPIGDEGHL